MRPRPATWLLTVAAAIAVPGPAYAGPSRTDAPRPRAGGSPFTRRRSRLMAAPGPDQVAIGLPAAVYAGNGFTSVVEVQKAFDRLAKGANCGSYRPRGVYPGLRGLMTWSINWDKYNASEFSTNHRRYLNALP